VITEATRPPISADAVLVDGTAGVSLLLRVALRED
jgi:hypothetical protein